LKLGILLVMIECGECERFEHGSVVFALDRVGGEILRVEAIVRASFVIENRGVKLFFGGEVAEDHGFGDTRRVCDFFGGGAAEASV